MSEIQLYRPGEEEVVYVSISETTHPTVFQAIVNEKVTKSGMTEKDAEAQVMRWPITFEVYYDPDVECCFLVESCYLENGSNEVFSPYTGKLCKPYSEQ